MNLASNGLNNMFRYSGHYPQYMMSQLRYNSTNRSNTLLQIATQLSGVHSSVVQRLIDTLLASGEEEQPGITYSTLNNDGDPLQFCITLDSAESRFRFIGDPAAFVAVPTQKLFQGREALYSLLQLNQGISLSDLCEKTLQLALPKNLDDLDELTSGVLWLGGGLEGQGVAVYITSRWGELDTRWLRVHQWLKTVLPDSEEATTYIKHLQRFAVPASIGIEGINATKSRAKVYWRLKQPILLENVGIPLLNNSIVHQFLETTMADNPVSRSGIVFSLGFSISTGKLVDAKIDLCAHCLPHLPGTWSEIINKCINLFALTPLPIEPYLLQQGCQVAFCGFGVNTKEQPRLNLYLKENNFHD